MAQKHRFHQTKRRVGRASPEPRVAKAPVVYEPRVPVVYGKPFVVVEDEQKNTFIFQGGAWVPHSESISECRKTCQVKVLPQKVNRMTRYEVRSPL